MKHYSGFRYSQVSLGALYLLGCDHSQTPGLGQTLTTAVPVSNMHPVFKRLLLLSY